MIFPVYSVISHHGDQHIARINYIELLSIGNRVEGGHQLKVQFWHTSVVFEVNFQDTVYISNLVLHLSVGLPTRIYRGVVAQHEIHCKVAVSVVGTEPSDKIRLQGCVKVRFRYFENVTRGQTHLDHGKSHDHYQGQLRLVMRISRL